VLDSLFTIKVGIKKPLNIGREDAGCAFFCVGQRAYRMEYGAKSMEYGA